MSREPSSISRRAWLAGTLAAGVSHAGTQARGDDSRIAAIRATARKAGMQPFDESETAHYVAIGDAPARFREQALAICEDVAADYFKLFRDKGFEPAWPKEKLAVVVLLGPKSYAMFEGGFVDQAVGGHYDLEANRLVMFDFRGPGANPKAAIPEVDNTLALVHETTHQLTYTTGLLDPKADVPLAISEGLATFGETWTPRHKSGIGAVNLRRRKGFDEARRQGARWIPVARLLADDKLLDGEATQQVAYAESWLLASKFMKDPARLPRFRDYLAALRLRPEPARRIEVATEHLGDLEKLDRELRPARM